MINELLLNSSILALSSSLSPITLNASLFYVIFSVHSQLPRLILFILE